MIKLGDMSLHRSHCQPARLFPKSIHLQLDRKPARQLFAWNVVVQSMELSMVHDAINAIGLCVMIVN